MAWISLEQKWSDFLLKLLLLKIEEYQRWAEQQVKNAEKQLGTA